MGTSNSCGCGSQAACSCGTNACAQPVVIQPVQPGCVQVQESACCSPQITHVQFNGCETRYPIGINCSIPTGVDVSRIHLFHGERRVGACAGSCVNDGCSSGCNTYVRLLPIVPVIPVVPVVVVPVIPVIPTCCGYSSSNGCGFGRINLHHHHGFGGMVLGLGHHRGSHL
ncbi:hypothetical protein RQP46_002489 [Phenoliferia psychrophenolica]